MHAAALKRLNTKYKSEVWKPASVVLESETHYGGTCQLYTVA